MFYQSIILNSSNDKEFLLPEILSLIKLEESIVAKELSLSISLNKEKKSIGIKEIEEVKSWNSLKSDSVKVCVITNADLLTTEAQNSLLKVLEEPSPNTLLVLITKSLNGLLTTIKSRCQVVNAGEESNLDYQEEIKNLLKLSIIERQKYFESLSGEVTNRRQLAKLVESLISYLSYNSQFHNQKFFDIISLLKEIYIANSKSVNIKLVIDNFSLCINQLLVLAKQ